MVLRAGVEPAEICNAENLWWRAVQSECFSAELKSLKKQQPVDTSSRLVQLCPVLDEHGVMRSASRLQRSSTVAKITRQPVLLDNKHPYTRLLVAQYHVWASHQGQDGVANELRQKYWIPGLRSAVRYAWNDCQDCKIRRSSPQAPLMADLPDCRLNSFVRPFTEVGVDYFGPLEVTVGRRHEKRYGVLFTCLSTRAIHLELAHSLSTDSAVMAIRRFISRRGYPRVFYSDNGTNFKGAERELREALAELDQQKLVGQLSVRSVKWVFNPPAAPHMGGVWERLVGSVKKTLYRILKARYPKEETLSTLLMEAESVVNSRPLTHVSVDPSDPEALTPNHFLMGTSSAVQLPGQFSTDDLCLRKQWRIAQALTDQFWRRWIKEYLPTLTRRVKWNRRTEPVKVGDIVIIADDNSPRGSWPKGKVSAVYPGRDGVVRMADVATAGGQIFRRPVAKLCVLDVK